MNTENTIFFIVVPAFIALVYFTIKFGKRLDALEELSKHSIDAIIEKLDTSVIFTLLLMNCIACLLLLVLFFLGKL